MGDTKISWAGKVWNPVVGCTKVSEGCRNCYAERIYERFHPGQKFSTVHCYTERLDEPLHWKKPARIFVNSMSDLFHKDVPIQFISGVWMRMMASPQHNFMILTKRPEAMFNIVPHLFYNILEDKPTVLPNVWIGVSVEDQKTADERIPWLLKTPAAVRFVSCEPLLADVDLTHLQEGSYSTNAMSGMYSTAAEPGWGNRLDWVIAGCESGPKRRPSQRDWFRSLQFQCQEYSIPYFLKQMQENGAVDKHPTLDGREWQEFPQVTP
jgi:protein gp37